MEMYIYCIYWDLFLIWRAGVISLSVASIWSRHLLASFSMSAESSATPSVEMGGKTRGRKHQVNKWDDLIMSCMYYLCNEDYQHQISFPWHYRDHSNWRWQQAQWGHQLERPCRMHPSWRVRGWSLLHGHEYLQGKSRHWSTCIS